MDKPKAAPPEGGLDLFFGGPTGLFSKALRDCAKTLDVGSLSAMGLDPTIRNMRLNLASKKSRWVKLHSDPHLSNSKNSAITS